MEKYFAIAIHGGASRYGAYHHKHRAESEAGLKEALHKGHHLLKRGKSALDAVEAAVMVLEDNPFFNAGCGSALNNRGEVEMDASIMDGKSLSAGAVSMVRRVKNPIFLARKIMAKTKHVFLSGYGALDLAKYHEIEIKPSAYFITDHQFEMFLKCKKEKIKQAIMHGTVGAVALDKKGNLAAATSTGGTANSLPGRIGDSCIIGAGCYANNKTCAVSGTGQGEFLITQVIAHTISMLMELKGIDIHKACDLAIFKRNLVRGEMGVIAINPQGKIAVSFNTKHMRRGFIDIRGRLKVWGL